MIEKCVVVTNVIEGSAGLADFVHSPDWKLKNPT